MSDYSITKLLSNNSINALFDIFETEKKEVRLVGGCIRNALLGIFSNDFDIAANIQPETIINILNKYDIQYEDFAYKYGSIIAFIDNQKFQITTLREDINQMGRHTNIVFTDDWKKDAQRRDFTINAIYLTRSGNLIDYFNGQKDLLDNKLQFIGNIDERIQEDFLRIYRYYRFLGMFKNPLLIDRYEEILEKYCLESFNYISNNLLRQEILKMFQTPYPLNTFFYNNEKIKRSWIHLTRQHFIKTSYDLGLNKCLNKIDLLIN